MKPVQIPVLLGLIASLTSGIAAAQTTPSWQQEAVKAVARIESQICIGTCLPLDKDKKLRIGTGFLVRLNGYDTPVLITALHVVAGASYITYAFTEVNTTKLPARVLGASLKADIAVLAVDAASTAGISPLALEDSIPSDNSVIIYGYKEGAWSSISDQGLIKLKAPESLSQMPLGNTEHLIRKLGYPDIDLKIVALEQALTPGDSGAPVFDRDGRVIGMGEGGIPAAQGEISWMIPSKTILSFNVDTTNIENLPAYGIREAYAAINTFYETPDKTRFGNYPLVMFSLEWPSIIKPLKDYTSRIDSAREGDPNWHKNYQDDFSGGDIIPAGDPYFPSSANDADLIALLDAIAIEVTCYRSDVFQDILTSSHFDLPQADLYLNIPIHDFTERVNAKEMGLSVDWNGPGIDNVFISSKRGLTYKPGEGSYRRHPDVEYLEDLNGGACRFRLVDTSFEKEDQIESLSSMMKLNGACLHLILSSDTNTPVAFTSYLPLGDDISSGSLWGLLPISKVSGTVDDMSCQ